MSKRLKVVVASNGTSGIPEFGGSTWVRLQYMLGLERLGIDCYWVDRLKPVDPLRHHHSLGYVTSRFEQLARKFGFGDRYCIVYDGGERIFGLDQKELEQLAGDADLLLNISGHLPADSALMRIPRRAYVDVDPGFTQIWARERDMGLARHNFFFSTGQNVGTDSFRIPVDGIHWVPILPPVALDAWPACIDQRCDRVSTVADWHAKQSAVFNGESYDGKRSEFTRFLDVPQRAGRRIQLALGIHQTEYEAQSMFLEHDWRILDPYFWAGDPESYREFIQFSRAEFSVAKHGYVKSNSGWLSDRTACYLASGKPALVQSTGFESALPTGRGLLTFSTTEEAVRGLEQIDAEYLEHCRAARDIAEKYFDSDVVLGRVLNEVGLG